MDIPSMADASAAGPRRQPRGRPRTHTLTDEQREQLKRAQSGRDRRRRQRAEAAASTAESPLKAVEIVEEASRTADKCDGDTLTAVSSGGPVQSKKLPYGGDIQRAVAAGDRAAVRQIMTLRDAGARPPTPFPPRARATRNS